jgi:hypothetical protein
LNKPFDFKNSDTTNLNSHLKEKAVEKLSERLIHDFSGLEAKNNDEEGFLEDTSQLTGKFLEFEENVLKLMDKKQNIDKELKAMEEKQKQELDVNYSAYY